MGEIAYLIGYFSIMIIFLVVAIKTQKMKWHVIGSVIQLLSLAGLTLSGSGDVAKEWLLYILILLVGIILVIERQQSEEEKEKEENDE